MAADSEDVDAPRRVGGRSINQSRRSQTRTAQPDTGITAADAPVVNAAAAAAEEESPAPVVVAGSPVPAVLPLFMQGHAAPVQASPVAVVAAPLKPRDAAKQYENRGAVGRPKTIDDIIEDGETEQRGRFRHTDAEDGEVNPDADEAGTHDAVTNSHRDVGNDKTNGTGDHTDDQRDTDADGDGNDGDRGDADVDQDGNDTDGDARASTGAAVARGPVTEGAAPAAFRNPEAAVVRDVVRSMAPKASSPAVRVSPPPLPSASPRPGVFASEAVLRGSDWPLLDTLWTALQSGDAVLPGGAKNNGEVVSDSQLQVSGWVDGILAALT